MGEKQKLVSKGDIILICCLLLFSLVVFIICLIPSKAAAKVIISVDGRVYAQYPIDKNKTVELESHGVKSVIEIEDGRVFVKEASCKGNDCVRQGSISKTGEMIVCLPGRMTVTLSGNDGDSDSITY